MLDEGSEAPNFLLPAVHDGEIREIALDDYLGRDVVVLAFYPADFNPTCTDEMCAIRDVDVFDLEDDVTVLAIAPDTVWSHRAFAEEYTIQFPLLSDSNGDVAEEYDVLMSQWRGHQRIPRRSVFVIDDRGRIPYAWCTEDQSVLPDLVEIREAIDSVQDDRTAVERYGRGYDQYQYGRSAFETGLDALAVEDWDEANSGFLEAVSYLDAAEDAFDSAHRFAESVAVRDHATDARDRSIAIKQSASWFTKAIDCYEADEIDRAEEFRADAESAREAGGDGEPIPEPETLFSPSDAD
jgi:peroxiredoxin